jgi:hypothetical protein
MLKKLILISLPIFAEEAKLTPEEKLRRENFVLRAANIDLKYQIAGYRTEMDALQREYVAFLTALCKKVNSDPANCKISDNSETVSKITPETKPESKKEEKKK